MDLKTSFKEAARKELLGVLPTDKDEIVAFLSALSKTCGSIEIVKKRLNLCLSLDTYDEGVKVVFTSAGSPKKYTPMLHEAGIKVAHVVPSTRLALKCQEAGVDAVVAEGFEAGGHNGREETTTLCLIPAVRKATTLPLMAAGGIATGEGLLAAMALGAEGAQIGTRFALTKESSAHENFKQLCLNLKEGDTKLLLKKLYPTRLVKGDFTTAVEEAEARGASVEELRELLGKGRAKKGIFEGDLQNGELEIGQIASLFHEEQSVAEVMEEIVHAFEAAKQRMYTI